MALPWWKTVWRGTLLSVGISDPYPELRPRRDDFNGEWVRFDQRPRGPELMPQRMSVTQTPKELRYAMQTSEHTVERSFSFQAESNNAVGRAKWEGLLLTLTSSEGEGSEQWSLSDDANELTVIEWTSTGKVVHSYDRSAR